MDTILVELAQKSNRGSKPFVVDQGKGYCV